MGQVLKEGSKALSSQNWKVFHPDGTHMFTCGEKKANWYLNTNDEFTGCALALKTGEYEITLSFDPKGKGYKKGEVFGLAGRKIQCVVSGEKEGLQRHHIVPYCYRTQLTSEYKSKNHHDVVLVTYKIHEQYEFYATKFKNQLAHEYGVPTLNELNLKYTKLLSEFSESKVRAISKLYSIFNSYGRIPQETINDNLKFVAEVTDISYEKKISKMNYIELWKLYIILKKQYNSQIDEFKIKNGIKYDHGKRLVEKLITHDHIKEFVKRWRTHFIDTMKPKYMPEGWSVDFRVKVDINNN